MQFPSERFLDHFSFIKLTFNILLRDPWFFTGYQSVDKRCFEFMKTKKRADVTTIFAVSLRRIMSDPYITFWGLSKLFKRVGNDCMACTKHDWLISSIKNPWSFFQVLPKRLCHQTQSEAISCHIHIVYSTTTEFYKPFSAISSIEAFSCRFKCRVLC